MLGDDSFLRCGTRCAVVRIRSLNGSRLLVMWMDRSICPLLVTSGDKPGPRGSGLITAPFFSFLFTLQRYTAFETSAFYSLYDWDAFILFLSTIYDSRG
jgi:hypothetical protein